MPAPPSDVRLHIWGLLRGLEPGQGEFIEGELILSNYRGRQTDRHRVASSKLAQICNDIEESALRGRVHRHRTAIKEPVIFEVWRSV